ncbi:MAG TPA: AarF/UbiB family protein [Pyrinomonadaceae bacterium]|nr:AarF/UbiB family protein [Pyrinomonadaceae bacterium]
MALTLSLKPEHLKRYKDVVALFIKYGRSDLVNQANIQPGADGQQDALAAGVAKAEELADDLEKLGPTFIKLGQLISTRADLLPEQYLEALARLQDKVEPFPFEQVQEIVERELGGRLSKLFAKFEPEPLAAASLGQVHRAWMRDGREVVVKVQRPNIRGTIIEDLQALQEAAEFIDNHSDVGKRYEFSLILSEFRRSLMRELDFKREADNLLKLRESLSEYENIVIPAPVEDYTSSLVLTMDFIPGKKITDVSPVRLVEIDGMKLAEDLFRAYLKQLLVDGFFHADPHPGNVFLTDDNRIALIDLGMVSHLSDGMREQLLRMLLAIAEGRGEEVAEITVRLGEARENFDETEFKRRVSSLVIRHANASLDKIDAGRIIMKIMRIGADTWFRFPQEYTMIAKAILNLDRSVYTLAPDFNPNDVIREESANIMTRQMYRSLEPGVLMTRMVELKEFVERLPTRVNKILDAVGNNELKIGVDAIDEKLLIEGLQKVANRITLGLILAALIVGAALMMRVESTFKILGYPGLPMIFFLVAAMGALFLAVNILFYDVKAKPPPDDE